MPDNTDDPKEGDEGALVPASTDAALVPREEAALAPVAGQQPTTIVVQGVEITVDAAHSQELTTLNTARYGLVLLAGLPAWNREKYGELSYPNFKILLAKQLSIQPAHVEMKIGEKLPKGADAQEYCLAMYYYYQQAQVVRGLPEPEEVAPQELAQHARSKGLLLGVGAGAALAFAVCCGVGTKVSGILDAAPAPETASKPIVVQDLPIPVPAVPFRKTGLTKLVDVSEPTSNPLSRADLDFLESCGAEGYVLVQCKDGTVYHPSPATYFLTDKPSDFVLDPKQCSEIVYSEHSYFHGPCGESFVENQKGAQFEWKDERKGAVKKGHTDPNKLNYRQIYPNPFTVCSDGGNAVFLAPIVPIVATDVPETCVAHPIHPILQ